MNKVAYRSKASRNFDAFQLKQLEETARRYNEDYGVTGVLLHVPLNGSGSFFVQYLEGGEDDLSNIMERVCSDVRHGDLDIFDEGPVDGRQFPAWGMKNIKTGVRPPLTRALQELLMCEHHSGCRCLFEKPIMRYLSAAHDAHQLYHKNVI